LNTFVLDTHTLVWFFSRDPRLGEKARAALEDNQSRLIIPVIVLAEIKHLIQKGRFAGTLDFILLALTLDPRCLIYPIDMAVFQHAPTELDIHDSLIVGTALAQPSPVPGVITRDEAIQQSGLVTTVW
jgi:PIN domain nuclease of toxin-antitoxin system